MTDHLSPRALAKIIGASESSLKRWIDAGRIAVTRTPGGHRRITQREALRFIREHGMGIIDPTPLGLSDLKTLSNAQLNASDQTQVLHKAIMDGDGEQVQALAVSMYLAGWSVTSLCDGPIASALHEVGTLWKHDSDGIHREHCATDVCLQGLGRLRTLIGPAPEDAPLALGGAPGGDPYLVPSLMAALILRDQGWRTVNLGPNIPLDSVQRATRQHQAQLVWISVSYYEVLPALKAELPDFAQQLNAMNCALVVGGQVWEQPHPPLAHVHSANSMAELAAFAQGIQRGGRASVQSLP